VCNNDRKIVAARTQKTAKRLEFYDFSQYIIYQGKDSVTCRLIPSEEQNAAWCGKAQLGLEFYESLALTIAISEDGFPRAGRRMAETSE